MTTDEHNDGIFANSTMVTHGTDSIRTEPTKTVLQKTALGSKIKNEIYFTENNVQCASATYVRICRTYIVDSKCQLRTFVLGRTYVRTYVRDVHC